MREQAEEVRTAVVSLVRDRSRDRFFGGARGDQQRCARQEHHQIFLLSAVPQAQPPCCVEECCFVDA